MNKKRRVWLIVLLSLAVLVALGATGIILKVKRDKYNESLTVGGEYDHWTHLNGTVIRKFSVTVLLVELNDENGGEYFDENQIILECFNCVNDAMKVSEGDAITFHFFADLIDGDTVEVSRLKIADGT